MLGPLAGGELLAIGSWRWMFLINIPLVIVCVSLILFAIPRSAPRERGRPQSRLPGALLCAAGLGGPVFALIEQPRLGWSSPAVFVPLIAGVGAARRVHAVTSRARATRCSRSGLFRRRNFSAGNIETFSMYAGLAVLFFFLVLFLQQIGGYTPLQSGLAMLPVTVIMFVLSRRFGALADRFGPRFFMGAGPLVAACRAAAVPAGRPEGRLRLRSAARAARVLARTVDDRGAADRGGARGRRETQAGIASGVNNAIARVAGLLGTAAVGAAVAGSFGSALDQQLAGKALGHAARAAVSQAKRLPLGRPDVHGLPNAQARALTRAAEQASLHSFHLGMAIAALLVAVGGVVGRVGIRNPRARGVPPRAALAGSWWGPARRSPSRSPSRAARLSRLARRRRPCIASMIGSSLRPRAVSRYSTVGGLEGITVRSISPAASRSRRRSESIRGEMPETASANSLKRSAPVSAA